MKRDKRPAPAGSSHQIEAAFPTAGKMSERELKTTSVLQSGEGQFRISSFYDRARQGSKSYLEPAPEPA